jgi:hypothetical protein
MSEFSNPAATGVADAAAYTASLLKLLGERDPLDVMRETPQKLSAAVKDVPRDRLAKPRCQASGPFGTSCSILPTPS